MLSGEYRNTIPNYGKRLELCQPGGEQSCNQNRLRVVTPISRPEDGLIFHSCDAQCYRTRKVAFNIKMLPPRTCVIIARLYETVV